MPPKKIASGVLGLDGGQDGHEVGGFVGGELLVDERSCLLPAAVFLNTSATPWP
jgi:hypothetical protein